MTYKYALGLNKKPLIRLSGLGTRINTPYTRDLVRRLNLAAVTVLGNAAKVLPLDPAIKDVAVLNVGEAAEIRPFIKQLSEYTHPVEFQLGKDLPAAGRKALRDKLSGYKRILVCVTEHRLAAYQFFLCGVCSGRSGGVCVLYSRQATATDTSGHIGSRSGGIGVFFE